MNKTVLVVGIGVLALGVGAFFLLRKKPSSIGMGKSMDSLGNESEMPIAESGVSISETSSIDETLSMPPEKTRKQIRRDCRREARAKCGRGAGKGKGKCRRQFRRECKAAGGFDDGGADFAFNGFDGVLDFV